MFTLNTIWFVHLELVGIKHVYQGASAAISIGQRNSQIPMQTALVLNVPLYMIKFCLPRTYFTSRAVHHAAELLCTAELHCTAELLCAAELLSA